MPSEAPLEFYVRLPFLLLFCMCLTGASFALEEMGSYVVFLVSARKLDYSSVRSLLKTSAKHPSDCSKNGDVGHAWILLYGPQGCLEGGQSGETGRYQPCYAEGVMENAALGARNPISYLWCSQCDGFFQQGNGGHRPTFAAKVALSCEEYEAILNLMRSYSFREYNLQNHQCTTFVVEVARAIGISLEDKVRIEIERQALIQGRMVCLWNDPIYSCLTVGSPDVLERSLKQLVREGKAQNVTCWYLKHFPSKREPLQSLLLFPSRFSRYLSL